MKIQAINKITVTNTQQPSDDSSLGSGQDWLNTTGTSATYNFSNT